ncbi:MAG TPA: DNA-3-methyladenine glycosylase 2 family protein [Nocardioidaceae bacterium]|nr:DNA-3-methyladenine glycosylase 2 family protein [Nocardioidaceae bacterium]
MADQGEAGEVRVWRPHWPCPVGQTLSILRKGPGDPTYRVDPDGTVWRGIGTPEGPAGLRLRTQRDGAVHATAWGDGAAWALDSVPAMLGGRDDPAGFTEMCREHQVLREAHRRHPHWRVTRTGLVLEALVPAIIEQKVTGQEAFAGFRTLVHWYGERAPGPHPRLWVQPSPQTIRTIPSWEWLKMHVDPARSRTAVLVAQRASALERTVGLPAGEVDRRLRSIPGVGVWTSAEVRFRAHGDADAVSFGDYHIPADIGWALTGEPVDDAGLEALLAPYRPHRYRVQRLVELAGIARPRRGPRMAPRTHLPVGR